MPIQRDLPDREAQDLVRLLFPGGEQLHRFKLLSGSHVLDTLQGYPDRVLAEEIATWSAYPCCTGVAVFIRACLFATVRFEKRRRR